MDGAQVVSQWQRDDVVIDNQSRQGQQGTMGGQIESTGQVANRCLRPVSGWLLSESEDRLLAMKHGEAGTESR